MTLTDQTTPAKQEEEEDGEKNEVKLFVEFFVTRKNPRVNKSRAVSNAKPFSHFVVRLKNDLCILNLKNQYRPHPFWLWYI